MRRVGEALLVAGAGLLIGLYVVAALNDDVVSGFWDWHALALILLTCGLVVEAFVALRWGVRRVGRAWR